MTSKRSSKFESSARVKREESFLMEDILDQRLVGETAMERAALISPYVIPGVTLGPNSSFRNEEPLDLRVRPTMSVTVDNKTSKRIVEHIRSPINAKDLMTMQHNLLLRCEDKRVKEEVRKKLEKQLAKENEHNRRIQALLESRKLEAERKHKARVDDLQRQLESVLKCQEQDEMIYQKQRAERTQNNRKLLEQQEKELRDVLKRLDDHFLKLDQSFSNIVKICSPEMLAMVDLCRSQFDELKSLKAENPTSFEILNNVCVKGEEICRSLTKACSEFEMNKKARQKEEGEKRAAEEAQARAQAQAQMALAASRQMAQVPPVQEQRLPEASTERPQIAQVHPVQEQRLPEAPPELPQIRPSPAAQETELGNHYNLLMQFLNEKQNATRELSDSPKLEGIRFALKLAVNKPINMLNETDRSKLQQSFIDLQNLLTEHRVNTHKGEVSIKDHPEARDWIQLRIAEKLIGVCDKKTATTFHVAALSVALCQRFPDFTPFLMAKLMKECPFLVPYKPPQFTGQSDHDFLRSWGYIVKEKNEPYSEYQSRTAKFAAFLAAMWITTSRRNEQARNPFGIDAAWTYLVNVLNSTPDATYCHLIEKVLEVAGASLHATYGQQFTKLMIILRDRYLPLVYNTVDEAASEMKAAWDRLRILLDKFFTSNRFIQPIGKLTPNYW